MATTDSLREAFGKRMKIGGVLAGTAAGGLDDAASLSPAELELVQRQFGVLTPENCMKPKPLEPSPGEFDFGKADALVEFAETHGLDVVGHTLVWHGESPAFLYAPGTSRQQALEQMQRHVMTVVGRYRGRIMGWDVVNEAIADQGDDVLRQTPCRAAVGEDYLERAFEFAREADPCAELYYNDYNAEQRDKRERTLRMLDSLQAGPAGVDGIGIQGHWILDRVPFEEIEEAIGIYAARGLQVMITELDLDVVERKASGADVSATEDSRFDPYRDGCPAEVLERQAEQYARLFEIFLRTGVARVTFWGLHDGRSWLNYWPSRRHNHALLFDREALPKPAFERVLEVARSAR